MDESRTGGQYGEARGLPPELIERVARTRGVTI